jgi:hypothetical protein
LDWNGFLCSYVLKSTVTGQGSQQKNFYLQGSIHLATIPTCVVPKAIYIRASLAKFLKRLNEFADSTVWNSMLESTIKQVVDYLFHGNVQPMAVYGQESCETIEVNKGKKLRYLKA